MAKVSVTRTLLKILKITGIATGSIVALLFLLPMLFPNVVANKIKGWANNSITGEMDFSKARLSFFKHFPSLTLSLYDFSLKGSAPFRQDTLIAAKEIALGINVASIFSDKMKVDKIFLSKGNVHIMVDAAGHPNYNVYKASATKDKDNNDSATASMEIKKIQIDQTDFVYDDKSIPILIQAQGMHYVGNGDLTKSLFDLYSKVAIDSFSLVYAGTPYVLAKKLEGNLITKVNTKSLAFIFQKNDLKINALPVQLNGHFGFLDNGYEMYFKLQSLASGLHDVFTALPPQYLKWLDHTTVKGSADVNATLSGKYIAATNTMPDITFNMKVRNGYIAHENAPATVSNLYFDFQTKLPHFNMDSFYVNVDSIFFNLGKDYFSAVAKVKGVKTPDLHLKLRTKMDLEKWSQATGIPGLHLKGQLAANVLADGPYAKTVVYKGLRKVRDTVIASIPNLNVQASLQNGYFRLDRLPQGIDKVHFDLKALCTDHKIEHIHLAVDNINAEALNNYIRGYVHVSNGLYPYIDASLHSILNLGDVQKFYPMDSLKLAGKMNVNATVKGKLVLAKRILPVSTVKIWLNDGSVQTKYYPHPLQNVQVDATIVSTSTRMRSLKVHLKPVSFTFEGQPFMLKADLNNFDNLKYDVTSKGTFDIGRIYKIFSQKGLGVTGKIRTDLALRGLQSDAVAGRYSRLHNSGSLRVEDIKLTSEMFPKALLIDNGLFRFNQDKMWFDRFNAHYGKSAIQLNGFLTNVIGYATAKNQPLKGQFAFTSPYVLADELMVFGDNAGNTKSAKNTASGVIVVPNNLDLALMADAKKIMFKGLLIKDFKGAMHIGSNNIMLDSVLFQVIDAPVAMKATYTSISPSKATFDYHISAKEFDIHKAYEKIDMVKDMMTSAKNVQGIVGLDYQLSGRLNKDMYPVMPSLIGQGTLSVKKVKLKGFKLFNEISKSANKDKMKDPDLSEIAIKSTIKNNILTIERTKMKIALLRPRFEGQVSLDGRLNIFGRIGLPPFGIFGIPFSVTGTQANPKVKLKRGKDSDKLDEEKDAAEH